MPRRWMLILSCVASCGLFLVYFRITIPRPPAMSNMGDGIFVAGQLSPDQVDGLRFRAIRSIIDLRPDGEAGDQTPSAEMAELARRKGMEFAYVPVPHGEVPSGTVEALAAALLTTRRPVLLYCRSGNRAVRACSLVLASDAQGPDENRILALARAAGHPVDDLGAAIHARIIARPPRAVDVR